jgi:aarF domain-containing kinase
MCSSVVPLPLTSPGFALCRAADTPSGSSLYTLAQLERASQQGLARLSELGVSLQADLADLQQRIPLLVRSIWGKHSEAVVGALRQRQAAAARLIARWEEAEHRLVAVANSLATLQNGQRLVAVGVPIAAAQLWPRTAHAYVCPAAAQQRRQAAELELTLGQIRAMVARLAAALREEAAILMRGLYLFALFLPAVVTAPVCLLADVHRQRWLQLLRWTLEQAGALLLRGGRMACIFGLKDSAPACAANCAACLATLPWHLCPRLTPACTPLPFPPPAGPAFIKWGQWAATRPDLFPPDACDALAALQTRAPTHAYVHTAAAVRSAFGAPIEELFSEFAPQPVASGSIAQVYRAVLSERGAELAGRRTRGGLLPLRRRRRLFRAGGAVAVKVRHPGVSTLMERDFTLMRRGAALLGALPLVGSPAIKESVMQVGGTRGRSCAVLGAAAAGCCGGRGSLTGLLCAAQYSWLERMAAKRGAQHDAWRSFPQEPAAPPRPTFAADACCPPRRFCHSLGPRCASSWTWPQRRRTWTHSPATSSTGRGCPSRRCARLGCWPSLGGPRALFQFASIPLSLPAYPFVDKAECLTAVGFSFEKWCQQLAVPARHACGSSLTAAWFSHNYAPPRCPLPSCAARRRAVGFERGAGGDV